MIFFIRLLVENSKESNLRKKSSSKKNYQSRKQADRKIKQSLHKIQGRN